MYLTNFVKKIKNKWLLSRLKDELVAYQEKYNVAKRNYNSEEMQECVRHISTLNKRIDSLENKNPDEANSEKW